jgi:exonuclease III
MRKYLLFLLFIGMVNFMSINANGLRTMEKFQRIVKMKNSDILCLQETHWDNVCISEVKKYEEILFLLTMAGGIHVVLLFY